MAPKTSRATKAKGKKVASVKTKRASKSKKASAKASKAAKLPKPTKAPKRPRTPKEPRPERLQKVPGGPDPLNTKIQIKKGLADSYLQQQIDKDDDELPNRYKDMSQVDLQFLEGSESNMTWGGASKDGGPAGVGARVGRGLMGARKRCNAGLLVEKKAKYVGDIAPQFVLEEDDIESDPEPEDEATVEAIRAAKEEEERIAKFGGRSPFLDLPREIREMIYGFLLMQRKPINLHCNWSAVHRTNGLTFDHAILRVPNHIINREATKLFYSSNTFHALVRQAMPDWRHLDKIYERFLVWFKDVVVEAGDRNVAANPEERLMHQTLMNLKTTDCNLSSLVILLSPYTVQNQNAQGLLQAVVPNASPVAYSDWFKKGAQIHRILTNRHGLRCKDLFVVVKLAPGGQDGRVVIRVATHHLPQNFQEGMITPEEWPVVKERIVASAERAKREIEMVAGDLEWLTLLGSMVLGWDDIRLKIANYEKERVREYGKNIEVRLRVMEDDEEIADLKWWNEEGKGAKRAAKEKELKDMEAKIARIAMGHDREIEDRPATALVADANTEQMQEIQHTADIMSSTIANVAALTTPAASAAASASPSYLSVPKDGQAPLTSTTRAHKERPAFRASNGELPSAPAVLPLGGSLAAVLGGLNYKTVEMGPLFPEWKWEERGAWSKLDDGRVAWAGPSGKVGAGVGEGVENAGDSEEHGVEDEGDDGGEDDGMEGLEEKLEAALEEGPVKGGRKRAYSEVEEGGSEDEDEE